MKKLIILYVGRNPEITGTMNRLLNARAEWLGFTTCLDDDALSICTNKHIDLVLLGNGLSTDDEQKLRDGLTKIRPSLKIIQHYGGGSGLLYGEIAEAINSRITFVTDDRK